MTEIVTTLPRVTDQERAAILRSPREADRHAELVASLGSLNSVEIGGAPMQEQLAARCNVVAWNVERCLFPEKSAAHILPHAPAVILLSEMDYGMARTGQRNTAAAMAEALDMQYAYGVEFFELGLGGPTERAYCKDDFNEFGWHGNAILSAAPIEAVSLIRLDQQGHWFADAGGAQDATQPRVGGRMALAARIDTEAGPVCFVSTHLESNAGAAHRSAEFDRLMDGVDVFAPGLPVLIGGDLNSGNHLPPDFDWRHESFFARAEARGFDWGFSPEGMTTRPSLITPHPTRQMKLDWFCGRGLRCDATALISAMFEDGTPLSDHDAVFCTMDAHNHADPAQG